MSGYTTVEVMDKHTTSKEVTENFQRLCLTFSLPVEVRYDGGPEFGKAFESFLTVSSSYHPESNSLRESNVKSTKLILKKCLRTKDSHQDSMALFNQLP